MARRKSLNRRSLKRRSSNVSGILGDSNVFGEEESDWWQNLDNETVQPSQSVLFGHLENTTSNLQADSAVEASLSDKEWWTHLNKSDQTFHKAIFTKRTSIGSATKLNQQLLSSESETEISREVKKRKHAFKVRSRMLRQKKSLRNTLDKSGTAAESEPVPIREKKLKQFESPFWSDEGTTRKSRMHKSDYSGTPLHGASHKAESSVNSSKTENVSEIVKYKRTLLKQKHNLGKNIPDVMKNEKLTRTLQHSLHTNNSLTNLDSSRSSQEESNKNENFGVKKANDLKSRFTLLKKRHKNSKKNAFDVVLEDESLNQQKSPSPLNHKSIDLQKESSDTNESSISISNQIIKSRFAVLKRKKRSLGTSKFKDAFADKSIEKSKDESNFIEQNDDNIEIVNQSVQRGTEMEAENRESSRVTTPLMASELYSSKIDTIPEKAVRAEYDLSPIKENTENSHTINIGRHSDKRQSNTTLKAVSLRSSTGHKPDKIETIQPNDSKLNRITKRSMRSRQEMSSLVPENSAMIDNVNISDHSQHLYKGQSRDTLKSNSPYVSDYQPSISKKMSTNIDTLHHPSLHENEDSNVISEDEELQLHFDHRKSTATTSTIRDDNTKNIRRTTDGNTSTLKKHESIESIDADEIGGGADSEHRSSSEIVLQMSHSENLEDVDPKIRKLNKNISNGTSTPSSKTLTLQTVPSPDLIRKSKSLNKDKSSMMNVDCPIVETANESMESETQIEKTLTRKVSELKRHTSDNKVPRVHLTRIESVANVTKKPKKVSLRSSQRNILDMFKNQSITGANTWQGSQSCKDVFQDPEKMKVITAKVEEIKKKALEDLNRNRMEAHEAVKKLAKLVKPKKKEPSLKPKASDPLKLVDKAYIVDGKLYKRPKLPRPKPWVTDRLYKFLWKRMEPRYKLETRIKSERFIVNLSEVVSLTIRRKLYRNYASEIDALMKYMARLGIIETRNDFYHFCYEFLPYDFRVKATPMLLPGNVESIPYNPALLHKPILECI
ncbi:nucleoprotein TPR [Orussus abietinus]|uniref:nucleoprotein TPR n=1 Tax=Orussus abietinus TaxID=222816 RepID=UPI0006252E77|nr:nucleoprotein TPR [Orussus abietinus]